MLPAERTMSRSEPRTLSRRVSPWTTTLATTIKGLQVARRYLPNLVGEFVSLALRILFFLLIANVVTYENSLGDGRAMRGRDLFLFFQGGLLLIVFSGAALWGPINTVTTDLYNGTLEFLYSIPGSRYAYYVGTVLTEAVIGAVLFVPFYIFLVVTARAGWQNMLMVILVCAVTLVSLTAMGVMIGLLALLWRQVRSLVSVLGILFEFLAGAYVPVSTFPQAVQYLAFLLPFTWAYDLIRYYSFAGAWETLRPVWQEWSLILLYAALYTLFSRYLLRKAEEKAKESGLHII